VDNETILSGDLAFHMQPASNIRQQNMDRRAQRTRGVLIDAFIDLVLSRGYAGITTAEISRRANVGRSTFYLHYAGKRQLLEESLKHPCTDLAACAGGGMTAPQLVPLLEHFREQRALNRVFFEAPIRPLWVRSLAALIEPQLPRARGVAVQAHLPTSLAALVVAEMQIALITHWLTGNAAVKSEIVAAQLVTATHALLSGMRAS
jgi:AcrR family transcriptional regulator